MSNFRVRMLHFVFTIFGLVFVKFSPSNAAVVSEEMELLKRQVETLITYREEDYNSLAAALTASVGKNEHILNLKSEVQNLR